RRQDASHLAAAMAAIAYAGGGHVLSQMINPAFLVSAAWLPWGWGCGDRLLRCRSLGAACLLAVIVSLMVLGGDPQTAYVLGLLLDGRWIARGWRARRFVRRLRAGGRRDDATGAMSGQTSLILPDKTPNGSAEAASPRKIRLILSGPFRQRLQAWFRR